MNTASAEPIARRAKQRAAAWIATVAMSLAFTLSYIDRQILSLLVTPIKLSLDMSDTQIGILQGVSFSIFNVLATLPLAALADRAHRPRLMAICMVAWSIATCASGMAFSFAALMVARVGVAVSEAGLPPAAQSLLADLHDRRGLARATSIFMLAPFVGGGLALMLGGKLYAASAAWDMPTLAGLWTPERWQAILLIAGLPGLVLAPLMLLAVREPRTAAPSLPVASARNALVAFLAENKAFCLPYMLAIALLVTLLNAIVSWMPTVLIQRHGVDEATVGASFGPAFIIAGALGTIIAGWVVGRFPGEHMLRRTTRLMCGGTFAMIAPAVIAPMANSLVQTIALLTPAIFILSAVISMSSIPFQLIAPAELRAKVLAVLSIFAAFIGTGMGPLAVGSLSDAISITQVSYPLATSLSLMAGICTIAITLLLLYASRRCPIIKNNMSAITLQYVGRAEPLTNQETGNKLNIGPD
ncbi:MFS transporter [Novosphingobium kaempferiae]|uniref:MFS transporter n=1 Tax=Novosphingobium kaempferiae TaxID=2896849 RepID=UPI001E4A39EC|nr:MFS transporter [Novosphingobium kaempferiae]